MSVYKRFTAAPSFSSPSSFQSGCDTSKAHNTNPCVLSAPAFPKTFRWGCHGLPLRSFPPFWKRLKITCHMGHESKRKIPSLHVRDFGDWRKTKATCVCFYDFRVSRFNSAQRNTMRSAAELWVLECLKRWRCIADDLSGSVHALPFFRRGAVMRDGYKVHSSAPSNLASYTTLSS